ncbi:MAG: hypothetical protein ACKOAU_21470 [Pirellula sp.]
MVEGLDKFADHFESYTDSYVLIGGTACDLAMQLVGQSFRATKDLDIVLFLEQRRDEFVSHFWEFVRAGGYQTRQQADGRPQYYRFTDPTSDDYPFMLELFSALPSNVNYLGDGHLVPIPASEDISSLSAILMDGDYSAWIQQARTVSNKVAFARSEHLITLKARAWLDLRERKAAGGQVDDRHIKKHKNDIFRLLTVVDPDYQTAIPTKIGQDMEQFVETMQAEPIDLKALGIRGTTKDELLGQLREMYR